MQIEWRDVPGFEDLYRVSEDGQVFSKRSGRIVKQTKNKAGYMVISTRIGGRKGKARCIRVHRMVAEAFIENPECKPGVNHMDGDKTNNRTSNLEWSTTSENVQHAYDCELRSSSAGEIHGNAKLTDEIVLAARKRYVPHCRMNGAVAIARELGMHPSTISSMLLGKHWNHI
jgi:hypothetical protein